MSRVSQKYHHYNPRKGWTKTRVPVSGEPEKAYRVFTTFPDASRVESHETLTSFVKFPKFVPPFGWKWALRVETLSGWTPGSIEDYEIWAYLVKIE